MRRRLRTSYEVTTLTARGSIVHPTVPSFGEVWGHPDIRYVPISDMPPSETALAWLRRASDPRLEAFISCARGLLTHLNGGRPKR